MTDRDPPLVLINRQENENEDAARRAELAGAMFLLIPVVALVAALWGWLA